MLDLLFDPPLYLIIGLLLVGVYLLYTGVARGRRGPQITGGVVIGLAIAGYVIGRLVETGPEKVTRLTASVVAAADRRDWPAFKSLLDPKVRFDVYGDRDQLAAGAAATVEKVGVKNVTTGGYDVRPEAGGYTVSFTATADIEISGQRTPTNWKFFWAPATTRDGYLLYRIDVLPTAQFGTEPVTSRLATPR